MSFCHQCGEQVASEDVFCPYCGISLTTVHGADDASMSETIVGMPPPVLMPEPFQENDEVPETASAVPPATDDAVPVSGNTSESVPFRTASIEIPSEQFDELTEAAFGDPSRSQENPESLPAAGADIAEAPMPHLIGEQSDSLALPKPAEALEAPEPDIEFIDSRNIFLDSETKNEPESATPNEDAESVSATESSAVADENVPPEDFERKDLADLSSEPELIEGETVSAETVADEELPAPDRNDIFSPAAEISVDIDLPEPVAEPLAEPPVAFVNAVADIAPDDSRLPVDTTVGEPASSEDEVSGPIAVDSETETVEYPAESIELPVAAEPPIAMPEMPLLLENERAATELDSVQIIQKSVAESLPKAPVPDSPSSVETPAEQREARPYTTPNIGKSDTDGRRSAKLKPLDEGTILNSRYEIVRKIGGGGMGAVYLANDRNLGGVLRAVKEMVQSYIESEQQEKAVADFKRESLLLTSLDHPAIPTIYDYFYDEKEARFYLVMKYISGGDLAGRLRSAPEGRIDEKSVTEWAIQVADVLHYLHTHEPSIVYRDLKPANVMIDGNSGRVMLIDFGIARWVNKEEKGVTAVGTMGYAPPELFSGNVEPRSDIYSLGSTMFHLLTGADPQSNPLLIFDFQKNPRPRQINSQLSDQIEQILMRSVEYSADARFTSASELRDALKDHFNNLQTGKITYGVKVAPSNRAFSEQLVFCGFCGKQIVATDVFCAFCGAQQPIAQQGVSQSLNAVQAMTAKLTLIGTGELEPSIFRLEKADNLLGRRDPMSNIFPEVDLSKYDPQTKISRRHARVWRDGNSFLVEDLGSSNGTTLLPSSSDSVRLLPHQPRTLTNGDKIRLGDTTLHFTLG